MYLSSTKYNMCLDTSSLMKKSHEDVYRLTAVAIAVQLMLGA